MVRFFALRNWASVGAFSFMIVCLKWQRGIAAPSPAPCPVLFVGVPLSQYRQTWVLVNNILRYSLSYNTTNGHYVSLMQWLYAWRIFPIFLLRCIVSISLCRYVPTVF